MTVTCRAPTQVADSPDTAPPTVGSGSERNRRDTKCLLVSRRLRKAWRDRSGRWHPGSDCLFVPGSARGHQEAKALAPSVAGPIVGISCERSRRNAKRLLASWCSGMTVMLRCETEHSRCARRKADGLGGSPVRDYRGERWWKPCASATDCRQRPA